MAYDPTFGYEVAVIIHQGLARMLHNQEDVFYYITVMNENYPQPKMPDGVEQGILRGMYLLRAGGEAKAPRVQLMGSGNHLREVIAAADLLKNDFGVATDIWSVPSFTELRHEGGDGALEPAASDQPTAVVLRRDLSGRSPRPRWSPPAMISRRSPIRFVLTCRGAIGFWVLMASGAAMNGRACAAFSKSIAFTSPSRR